MSSPTPPFQDVPFMIRSGVSRPTIRARITGEIFAKQRFGGVSRYCVELARELNLQESTQARIDANIHINEYLWQCRREVNNNGIYLNRGTKSATRICRAGQTVKNKLFGGSRHEVVHASYYGHEQFSKRQAANVCTFYDMIHERFSPHEEFLERKRRSLQAADRCIAISEATKADMVYFLDADPDAIDVVYLASRMSLPMEVQPATGKHLLWVGARGWYKNFDNFAQGFSESRAFNEGITVICAGGPPFTPQELQRWHELGLSPGSVQHVQPSDDELAILYARSIALVYVSLYEGFGIPPLEAMMCNCPVIASPSGSISEVVGDAALIVDPESPDSIASRIDEVLYSSDAADRLRQRGKAQAAKFSWARCARETLSCYQQAMENAGMPVASAGSIHS